MLLYSLVFFIPKPVQFNYAGRTCVPQLTLFPSIHKAAESPVFTPSFADELKVGLFAIVSMKTCFTAISEPQEGNFGVSTAPFGSFLFRKTFSVNVPSPPVVNIASLEKPLPVTKPLTVDLSTPDGIFNYSLESEKKSVNCTKNESDLSCNVPGLELKQGKEYSLSLTRQFKNGSKKMLVQKMVKTLRAVTIKKKSVKNKQVIYSKPKAFTFITDKPLRHAEATLISNEKENQPAEIETKVKDKTLTIKLAKQLAREKAYTLILTKVEAIDGSTLTEPEKISFKISGGPAVTGINIGKSRVSGSAVVVIKFDQKLSSSIDITKYVSLKGGSAVITKGSSSVSVALQGLPRCKVFSVVVAENLPSKYDIKSKEAWSYASRTQCHTVVTYGTSVQGRPLNAYIFGNSGPVTMYVGAIHGSEPSSSGLMQAWVNELESQPNRITGRRIVVVPTINPDGMATGSRTNSRGVNLNRNFPTDNWEKDIDDTDGKHKGGGGKNPLSEPEAKALATLTQQYKPRLLLSFHAIGSLVQGDSGSPSASYAAKYASMVGYSNATGQGDTFDYGITGGYEDWAWRNVGIPAMVVELGSYSSYYIDHHKAALWAML